MQILPVFIRTYIEKVLGSALGGRKTEETIIIEVGDEIDFKTKDNIQELYKKMFRI